MSFRILLTKSAVKELDRLPVKIHDDIVDRLRQLEENPRIAGAEKLTAISAYKMRVRNYRIIYQIDDAYKEITVVMIDDRKQVYKRLRRRK